MWRMEEGKLGYRRENWIGEGNGSVSSKENQTTPKCLIIMFLNFFIPRSVSGPPIQVNLAT